MSRAKSFRWSLPIAAAILLSAPASPALAGNCAGFVFQELGLEGQVAYALRLFGMSLFFDSYINVDRCVPPDIGD